MKKLLFTLALSMSVSAHVWARRDSYALERYDISDLTLTLTWSVGDAKVASIRDKEGYVYSVLVGDYLGKNLGFVKAIENDKIEICEYFLETINKVENYVVKCHWMHKKVYLCDESKCSYR